MPTKQPATTRHDAMPCKIRMRPPIIIISVEVSPIEAGQPLTVFAEVIKGCHTEDLELFCTATVEGDTIVVTTETTWRRTEPLAMSCEAIAYVAQTSCETDVALEEGTYAVVYADQILDVVVPSSGDAYDCLVP